MAPDKGIRVEDPRDRDRELPHHRRRWLHRPGALLRPRLPLDVEVGAGVVHVAPDDFLASRKGFSADDFRQAADHIAAMEDAAKAALTARSWSRDGMAAALRDAYRGIDTRPAFLQRLRHD